MIGEYLIGTIIISMLLFFNRSRLVNYILVTIFLVMQWVFTVYEYNHRNIDEFYDLFKPDALAILLLITLSIIAIPAYYHSYVYFLKNKEIPRERAIYFSAMTLLIAAISAAYLSILSKSL